MITICYLLHTSTRYKAPNTLVLNLLIIFYFKSQPKQRLFCINASTVNSKKPLELKDSNGFFRINLFIFHTLKILLNFKI